MENWDVVPDIMILAKGLTSGYIPLGATMARKYISDGFKERFFDYGASYGGHALGCAAALAVISVYQEDRQVENSAKMGVYLLERAMELKEKHPSVGDVRGIGLFVGLELVKNKKTKEPIMPVAAKILPGTNPKLEVGKKLAELNMMAMTANPSNVIGLSPPLGITKDEIDEGIANMDIALEAADAHTHS
jgi:taurine--2-oxoglutarate transaminase